MWPHSSEAGEAPLSQHTQALPRTAQMAAQLESRGRDASRLVGDLSGSLLERFPKLREFREAAPEHVADDDLLREWERCGHDKDAMFAKIAAWWNDLPDTKAVQGQSTSWEQVSHKKKHDELSDKFTDLSMRDRKNRGRSAPPTRGGRGGRGGGRASSVGIGRGGRGAPRGPRPVGAPAAQNGAEQAAAAPAVTKEQAATPAAQAEASAPPQQPTQAQKQPQEAPAPAPAPTYSSWNGQVSFAEMVKKQAHAQAQAAAEPAAAAAAEQVRPQANGAAAHQSVDEDANASGKQGSGRGRGGRGRGARGEGRAYRSKEAQQPTGEVAAATAATEAPVDEARTEAAPVEHQPAEIPVEAAQPVYEPEQEVDEHQKGYLNMGKWESTVGGASPEVGSFQFGSFGGSADFDSAAAAGWGASDQLGANSWEVDGDNHALDQGMTEQGSNAAVNSLFDNSAQESQLHQTERRTSQPPGFDNADTNPPPGLDGLHTSKHDAPGSRRGHQGGRHYQSQRGPSQHQQQQGMPQQPMAYGHPYGLGMGMGDAPGTYMPYMPGFGGGVSAPTSTTPTGASTSASTATGSSPSTAAAGMAHMQQPYGAPQPGMMPGSAGYSPYYFYPPMYYQQPTGHYYNRGSQAMYQAPRGPYMSYDQPTTGPMYGQYEGMYGMHGVPHSGPAPSSGGKGSSGSKGGSSSTSAPHHAAAAAAPDMGLNPSGSYPFYGSREGQSWYSSQPSWGHGGAAPYPQSPQTGGSGSGTGFSQSRK